MNSFPKSTIFTLLFIFSWSFLVAQTDPGTANLTHQWTFDDGTATDKAGNTNGTLSGGATIVNKALRLSSAGQYLSFSGASLALNTYSAITQEIWFTPQTGANTGYTMLSYFGNSSGGSGYNYISMSAARGDNVSRVAISNGTYNSEKGVNGTEYDDGKLHQMVSVIRADSVILYIDGVLVGKTLSNIPLTTIANNMAYLGKGGYTSDPTWLGTISKYSIYNKSLTASEIKYLYQKGAEESEFISTTTLSLSFDEFYKSESIKISGQNLKNPITISAPAGITVNPATLEAGANNSTVLVTYDGTSSINGNISFSSGNTVMNIPVKSFQNNCFSKLYPNLNNYVSDPYLNTVPDSWGNVSLAGGTEAFCGSHCIKISGTGSCWPNGGSISTASINWIPYATYRFRAKVKTMDGSFNMGVQNANVGGASGDYNILVPATNGVWTDFDATFTAGPSPTSGVAFFNNCGSATGLTAYIDNWELYLIPSIAVSTNSIAVDENSRTSSFTVRGINLTENISIVVPGGILADQTSLAPNSSGVTVTITYDGTTAVNGNIVLTSGSVTRNIAIKSMKNSSCFTPLFPDQINLIPSPYMDDLTNFTASSGNRSINTDPAYSYCGASSGKVTDAGTITRDLTGIMKPNTTYRVKAKVFKCNPGNITYTLGIDPKAYPTQYALIKTAMDSACSLFNQYTPLSANIYVYYDSGIPTAQASNYGSIGFGASTNYMWVGTTIHEMDHYFGSGTNATWKNLVSGGAWKGAVANKLLKEIDNNPNTSLSSDGTHFWPYGINYRSEIENLGGNAAQLKGLINAVKIAKAMIVDDAGLGTNKNPVGISVYGWNGTATEIFKEVTTPNKWQDVDFTFTTGATLGTSQGISFKSGSGYIDNWEMYETSISATDKIMNVATPKAYITDNKLITELETERETAVKFSVYDMQGKLMLDEKHWVDAGKNKITTDFSLPGGLYLLKLISNDFSWSIKIKND